MHGWFQDYTALTNFDSSTTTPLLWRQQRQPGRPVQRLRRAQDYGPLQLALVRTARTPPRFPAPLPIATCCWASTRSSPSRSRPTPRLRARPGRSHRHRGPHRDRGPWVMDNVPPAPARRHRVVRLHREARGTLPGQHPRRRAPASSHVAHQPAGRRQLPPGSPTPTPGTPKVLGGRFEDNPQRLVDLQRRGDVQHARRHPQGRYRQLEPRGRRRQQRLRPRRLGRWRRHRQRRRHLDPTTPRGSRGPRPSATSRA